MDGKVFKFPELQRAKCVNLEASASFKFELSENEASPADIAK